MKKPKGFPLTVPPPRTGNAVGRPRVISLAQRMRARMLFFAGWAHSEIADEVKIDATQSRVLAHREGWAKQRRHDLHKRDGVKRTKEEIRADTEAMVTQWQSEISMQSQSLSLDGMQLARRKLDAEDARGFKDAAQGIKAFVDIAREAEGLSTAEPTAGGVNVSLFYLEAPQAAQPERIAESIHEVAAIEVGDEEEAQAIAGQEHETF